MGLLSKLIGVKATTEDKNKEENEKVEVVNKAQEIEALLDVGENFKPQENSNVEEILDGNKSNQEIKELVPEECKQELPYEKVQNTADIEAEVRALLESTISKEERLEELEKKKKKITGTIENLLSGREKLLKAKNYCGKISRKKFDYIALEFSDYVDCEDFKDLEAQHFILETLKEMAPEVFELENIPATELRIALNEVRENFLEIENIKLQLKDEGATLRNEINRFTAAVNETKSKHKLSPDWEGKKQPLITMQGKLAERRESYLKKEKVINKKIEVLYVDYEEIHEAFRKHSPYFSEVLDSRAADFVKDPNRAQKLQELLKEKSELEAKENAIKHS